MNDRLTAGFVNNDQVLVIIDSDQREIPAPRIRKPKSFRLVRPRNTGNNIGGAAGYCSPRVLAIDDFKTAGRAVPCSCNRASILRLPRWRLNGKEGRNLYYSPIPND